MSPFRISAALLASSLALLASHTNAQDAPGARIDRIIVEAEAESDEAVQMPFLPPVQGTRINSGKKTSVIDLDEFPPIINNNYRQALAKTPGLFLSEESSPLVSIGYRGLDPGRVQFTQVLKDGVPIHADQFGYPEAYYTPPLDTVDRIEFLHGGAALVYGPQPGGALNFITHRPRTDRPFSFGTRNTFGSDGFYSNFTYVDGTRGPLGYYGYYNHRSGEGFRESNSAFDLDAGLVKLVLGGSTDSRLILTLEGYDEQHGEPGGLTFATGEGAVNYNTNRNATSRLYDQFRLERYFASLVWEKDFSKGTKLSLTGWGGYYSRFSVRQRGGGFGTLPGETMDDPNTVDNENLSETTTVERQEFYTEGFETRLRHDYELWGGTHTIAGGLQAYYTFSPRQDRRGETENAQTGELRNDNEREVFYLPFFVENRFHWGAFSVTPGVRFENIWQGVTEHVNEDKKAAAEKPEDPLVLADESDYEFVPLFGIGVTYELAKDIEIFGNVSQSYRPKIFTQSVPTGGTTLVPEDLRESSALQYDIGFRGNPTWWSNWDVSAFLLDFDDQIGTVALPGGFSTLGNVGRAQHYGIEAAGEIDLVGAADAINARNLPAKTEPAEPKTRPDDTFVNRFGSISLYGNVTLLHAEFVSGPLEGDTPRAAPDYLLRGGAIYRFQDRVKIAFLGTLVGDSFADDGNTAERFVPAHTVWDLTAEAKVYKDTVSVTAGINNLFNEDYYARITNSGIDPAAGRNYYGGISVKF